VSNPEEGVPDIEKLPKDRKLGFPVKQLEKGKQIDPDNSQPPTLHRIPGRY
jgi:hypothetical protein